MAAQWMPDSVAVVNLIEESAKLNSAERAIAKAREAEKMAKKFSLHLQIAARSNLLKTQLKFDENYDALRTYLEFNRFLEQKNRWADVVTNIETLSNYYATKKLYASAIEKNKEAAALAKKHNVDFDFWRHGIKQGDLFFAKGDFETAKNEFYAALELLKANPQASEKSYIINYRKIAVVQNQLQNYDEAIRANKEVLARLENSQNTDAYTTQLNNLGYSYQKSGNTKEALGYFENTLKTREQNGFTDEENRALLINIGIAYQNLHKTEMAKTYLQRAQKASTQPDQKAAIYDLIAMAYLTEDDVVQAKEFNTKSLAQAKIANNKRLEAEGHLTASVIYEKMLVYDKALVEFKRYLDIKDSLDALDVSAQQNLLQAEYTVERTQGEIESLITSNAIKDFQIMQLRLESENGQKQLQLEQAESKAKLQALQLQQAQLEADKKAREVEILKASEENARLLLEQQKLQESQVVKDLQIAEEKNRVQKLQLEQRKANSQKLLLIILFAFVLAIFMIFAWLQTRKKNKLLGKSKEEIKLERDRSDALLLNVLPESTANELKQNGRATPRMFESATVFFSDFQSFSALSKDYDPEELIGELELFFSGIDEIIAKYGIEKIKTIGDAYMCASGLPTPNADHAESMIKAALEIIAFTQNVHQQQIARGKKPWHLRIGINSGPVVAGVVGTHKFIYDVWGDTVNLASRLESTSEADRINISQNTFDLVKDVVNTTYRGEIEIKNMGIVPMYFVDGLRVAVYQGTK